MNSENHEQTTDIDNCTHRSTSTIMTYTIRATIPGATIQNEHLPLTPRPAVPNFFFVVPPSKKLFAGQKFLI